MGAGEAIIICVPLAFLVGLSANSPWFNTSLSILTFLFVLLLVYDCTCFNPWDFSQKYSDSARFPFDTPTYRPINGMQIAHSVQNAQEKTPEDTEATNQEDSCVVCLVHKKNHVVMPCRHLCLCGTCKASGEINECPICREPNITFISVY